MRRYNEDLIGIEVQRPNVPLRFRVQVVVKTLALHPAHETPLAGATWQAARPAMGSVMCTSSGI